MNDSEPLEQFMEFWDGPFGKRQWIDHKESVYRLVQRAFSAGYAARPRPPVEPSRDALTTGYTRPPSPDFIQHGTITGRIPPLPEQIPVPGPYVTTEWMWQGGRPWPDATELARTRKSQLLRELNGGPLPGNPVPPEETMLFGREQLFDLPGKPSIGDPPGPGYPDARG